MMDAGTRFTIPASALLAGIALCVGWGAQTLVAGDRHPGMVFKDGVLTPDESLAPGKEPATGLERRFPPPLLRADNPTTPERAALGRLLFFDPIVSGDDTMSCAHCHHPDLGLSDGLPRARGKGSSGVGPARSGGVELARAAPTLWNALYNHRQFWDGRSSDLEDQAKNPITHPDEMGEDPAKLVNQLSAIDEYRRLFDRAFAGKDGSRDGSAVTFDNAVKAIAAFERTLVSFRSRFDHYAAGKPDALSVAERRGLKLFLSPKTRCVECHGLPNFANREFKVIGVPDPPGGPRDEHNAAAEPGRGGGPTAAFKVPTLRNVALTAPYMHNGIFRTLEDVLDFYAGGGGRGRGLNVPLQDDKVRQFPLTLGEKADIVAFLGSLTDASALPEVPGRVPSGLPVVARVKGPAAAVTAVAPPTSSAPPGTAPDARPLTIDVHEGESIQDTADKAGRGGRVRVHPGTYHENVLVIHHDVTVEGVAGGSQRPILDGRGELADGIAALGNGFTVSGLEIRNYQGNGAVVHGAKGVTFRDLVLVNPGFYGVYPVECDGVLVEKCTVSGARDAGIYVGQSRSIVVRGNDVSGNVAGIEIENSVGALVERNHVHGNTGGILVFVLPFNPSKVGSDARVIHNRVIGNNTPNFAAPGATVASVLKGTGILILAADRTEVSKNEIAENGTYGIAVNALSVMYPPETPIDVDPSADGTRIHSNQLRANGLAPDERLERLFKLPGRDLIWDGTGKSNVWRQPGASSYPEKLPGEDPAKQ